MYGTSSELSIASRSSMASWISDSRLVDEIHKKRRRVCKRWRKTCTRDLLYRRLPFLSWITKYDFSKLLSDANAGMAVSLTAIPQTIGYAAVAGLPAQVISLFPPTNFHHPTVRKPIPSIRTISLRPFVEKPIDLIRLVRQPHNSPDYTKQLDYFANNYRSASTRLFWAL